MMRRRLALLLLSLMLAGCAALPAGERWLRSEVFFGLSRPDGTLVTQAQWQVFMDDVVTPQFPAGLTVIDATGQWRNASGRIDREHSKVLVLLHPPGADSAQRIDAIRAAYRSRFDQEAVMKVTTAVDVVF